MTDYESSTQSSGNTDDASSMVRSRTAISIDSQSFVNVGQLMGSRGHGVATGGSSNLGGSCSIISCSDSDADGLRDFDQIVHPGSSASAWSGHELGSDDHDAEAGDDDDNDSVLPALPRSPCPGSPIGSDAMGRFTVKMHPFNEERESGWEHEMGRSTNVGADHDDGSTESGKGVFVNEDDFSLCENMDSKQNHGRPENELPVVIPASVSSTGDDRETSKTTTRTVQMPNNKSTLSTFSRDSTSTETAGVIEFPVGTEATALLVPSLRESWLHVPVENEHVTTTHGIASGDNTHATENPASVQQNDDREKTEINSPARMGHVSIPRNCGCCFTCGVEKAVALARPSLEYLVQLAKIPMESGLDMYVKWRTAIIRGQKAVLQAVNDVPQAPGECCQWCQHIPTKESQERTTFTVVECIDHHASLSRQYYCYAEQNAINMLSFHIYVSSLFVLLSLRVWSSCSA